MSHVMIQNKGELPLWGMRLMGLSDKTADKIGRFGTGLKESIALLARLGLQPIIFSGELRMDFKVELLDSQEEICFKLSEERGRFAAGIWHGLGIHPNLGKHDWDDPWMIFREVVCNALDASGTDDLFHDICYHEPAGVPGSTRFYIPATESIVNAYNTIEDKLLPLGKYEVESETDGIGRAIKNRKDKPLQVFHRGVWIQAHDRESLFDYEIADLKLNESRSADWHTINSQVARLVACYTQHQAQLLLNEMITLKNVELYEREVLQSASYYSSLNKRAWCDAFFTLFGDKAVLTDNSQFLYEKLRAVGKEPIVVSHPGLTSLLRAAGVTTVDQVLTREQRKWEDIRKAEPESHEVFDQVWSRLHFAGLTFGAEKPELHVFTEQPGKTTMAFGTYSDGKVYVNASIVGSVMERRAYIEELAHHISEASDETREFQTFLLEIADHFMFGKRETAPSQAHTKNDPDEGARPSCRHPLDMD